MQRLHKVIPNACIGQGYGKLYHPSSVIVPPEGICIGQTETCTSIAMMPPAQKLATVGSVGHLMPGTVARVLKPDGSLASEGERGELVVTGPSMASGYLNNEAA